MQAPRPWRGVQPGAWHQRLVASGCTPLRTAREVRQAATVGFIGGGVKVANGTAETYVLLYAIDADGKVLVDACAALSALTTTWSFMCQDRDRFVVGAFKDLNADGVRDPANRPATCWARRAADVERRAQMTGLTVALDKGMATSRGALLDVRGEASGELRRCASRWARSSRSSPRFDAKNASAGLWTRSPRFAKRVGNLLSQALRPNASGAVRAGGGGRRRTSPP